MGDGVTGSVNAPINHTTNASQSSASSRANTTAQVEFGSALELERCPEGLGRRHQDPCTYLRPPSQSSEPSKPTEPSKPVDINVHGDPDRFKGPMNGGSKSPDMSRPPQLPESNIKVPDGPGHNGGLGSGDGAHIFTWEFKHNRL